MPHPEGCHKTIRLMRLGGEFGFSTMAFIAPAPNLARRNRVVIRGGCAAAFPGPDASQCRFMAAPRRVILPSRNILRLQVLFVSRPPCAVL